MNLRQAILEKGKCPLEFLESLGRRTENAWLFIDKTLADELKKSAYHKGTDGAMLMLSWEETEDHPKESIQMRARTVGCKTKWYEIVQIKSEYIAFTKSAIDPEEIFFIRSRE